MRLYQDLYINQAPNHSNIHIKIYLFLIYDFFNIISEFNICFCIIINLISNKSLLFNIEDRIFLDQEHFKGYFFQIYLILIKN